VKHTYITRNMCLRSSRPTPCKNYITGFTLIELMITLVITGVMLSLALPAFSNMVMNARLTGQIDELKSMLNYARSTALSQNSPIQVCPVGAAGSTTCGSSWAAGWMVVTAPTAAAVAAGVNPTLLQSHTAPSSVTLAVSSAIVTPSWITFDTHGITTTTANFAVCDSRGSTYARTAYLSTTGSIQSGAVGVAAWSGGAATCTP